MLSVNRVCILLILAIALTACASTPGQQATLEQHLAERNYRLGDPVERILNYKLDGWTYLDRKHVIMQTAPSTNYLVSLKNTCHGLSNAETIAFTTTTSQLTTFDKLMVMGSGRTLEHCYIEALNKLEKAERNPAGK